MNPLTRFVWIGLLLGVSSCNQFVDQQPEPDEGPPAETVQALLSRFARAEEVRFSTLLNNKLWQVDFSQHRLRYQGLMGPGQLLTTDQLLDGNLPDSLTRVLQSTVFAGGTIARPRLHLYERGWTGLVGAADPRVFVMADYTWQQQPYTALWSVSGRNADRSWYNVTITPFQRAAYSAEGQQEIPELIQAQLRNDNMTFLFAQVQVDAAGQYTYIVSASRQGQFWNLTFTSDGQLIAVRNQATVHFFQETNQLPPAAQAYLRRPELAGFALARGGSYARHSYGSLNTYEFAVEKGTEAWDLRFSDSGQLISRSYRLYGTF